LPAHPAIEIGARRRRNLEALEDDEDVSVCFVGFVVLMTPVTERAYRRDYRGGGVAIL
jgi:hypothetical protein